MREESGYDEGNGKTQWKNEKIQWIGAQKGRWEKKRLTPKKEKRKIVNNKTEEDDKYNEK